MAEENYILMSLKDAESKKLAQVISNETSRKILDFLASKKDAAETEIAKELKIPLSTAHYNLKALVKSRLVKVDEFHYSKKGKEVNHYCLANKFIVIAPAGVDRFKQTLRNFLPIGMIGLCASGVVYVYQNYLQKTVLAGSSAIAPIMAKSAEVLEEVAMDQAVAEGAPQLMANALPHPIETITREPNIALWFLFGTVFTLLIMVMWEWLRQKKR